MPLQGTYRPEFPNSLTLTHHRTVKRHKCRAPFASPLIGHGRPAIFLAWRRRHFEDLAMPDSQLCADIPVHGGAL